MFIKNGGKLDPSSPSPSFPNLLSKQGTYFLSFLSISFYPTSKTRTTVLLQIRHYCTFSHSNVHFDAYYFQQFISSAFIDSSIDLYYNFILFIILTLDQGFFFLIIPDDCQHYCSFAFYSPSFHFSKLIINSLLF